MLKKLPLLALFLAACGRSDRAGGRSGTDTSRTVSARLDRAVAFRIPAGGGALQVYTLPALDSTSWGAGSRLSGVRTAIGVDLPGRRLLFRDSTGGISSFDLVSLRQKSVAPRRTHATIAADGALLAVDSTGHVAESQPWGQRTWPDTIGRGVIRVFASPGPRLMAVRRGRNGDALVLATRENGLGQSYPLPPAHDETASRDGDAIALATDTALIVYEDRDFTRPWSLHLGGNPVAVAFSPSGHRLYVALEGKSQLSVIDRYTHHERSTITLPGPASALRADPWGRALLVRGDTTSHANEIWVVGIAKNDVTGTIHGQWSADLPTAAEDGVLLSREGTAIVARDIHSLDSLAAIPNASGDLWFAGRWTTPPATAGVRAAAAAQTDAAKAPTDAAKSPAADTAGRQAAAPAPAPAPAAAANASFWIQITSTRSEASAKALVAELQTPRAQVLSPKTEDDTWRVVVGPFGTRESADSAGRSIGRPYWVIDRAREPRP